MPFLADQEFTALVSAAEAMLPTNAVVEPRQIAARVDDFLRQIDAPAVGGIRNGLVFLEDVAPLLALRLPPFSGLTLSDRRHVIEAAGKNALLRPLAQTLKLLVSFSYYTTSPVRQKVGFIDFEQRPRSAPLDKTPLSFADPLPVGTTPGHANGKYDVIVIGAGAAGGVMSYRLAVAGLRVLIIEKGSREDPVTFTNNEYDMVRRVYKEGGLQTTSNNRIAILQGATVGGSTVINNAIWLRPDLARVLPDWEARGAHLEKESLIQAYEVLEGWLGVNRIPVDICNGGTSVFLDGFRQLGIGADILQHNRRECLGCGFCNFGCRYNRKASALVTFIPWAESRGADIRAGCQEVRLISKGDRVVGVEYQQNGNTISVQADRYVVAAGAIGSSVLLLNSGLSQNGTVGTRFHLLGGCTVTAVAASPIDSYDRIGLTAMAVASDEYVIESFFSPPGTLAVTLGGWFETHAQRMLQYRSFAQAGVMTAPEPIGEIKLSITGDPIVDLSFESRELERLKKGVVILSKAFFKAGAVAVYPSTFADLEFNNSGEIETKLSAVQRSDDFVIGSAHPQGGNPMHENAKHGAVGLDFRLHGFRNLFVADASVFPSNIMANCQATVMATAYMAAEFVMK